MIISFDLDGTLIQPEFSNKVWHEGMPWLYAKRYGIEMSKAQSYVEEEYQKIGEGRVEWYDIKYWCHRFGLNGDWEGLLSQYEPIVEAYPEVYGVITRLKRRFDLILTSNAAREFIEIELKASKLSRYFSSTFSAPSDFGMVKKAPSFFTQILRRIKIHPGELIHIGDHVEFDFHVPRSLGIKCYYLDRSGKIEGEFILHSLEEIKEDIDG